MAVAIGGQFGATIAVPVGLQLGLGLDATWLAQQLDLLLWWLIRDGREVKLQKKLPRD